MQKSNDSTRTIEIRCQGAATQELDNLTVLQGGLKKLSKKNLERLKARITTDGFCAPIFIWDHDGALMILDGTQRRAALLSLRDDGWTVPPLPVVYIHAPDEPTAKRMLLSISSQYGEWVEEELTAWLDGFDDEIRESLRLVDKEIIIGIAPTFDDDEIPEDPEPITKEGDVWELGNHRLICANCLNEDAYNILIGEEKIDMVITDPPYGIDIVKNESIGGSKPFGNDKTGKIIKANNYKEIKNDDSIETALKAFELFQKLKIKNILMWGGNYFAHKLPPTSCWVIWDKMTDGHFADGEIAYCTIKRSVRIFRHQWSGMIKESEKKEKRVHPTQKPVALTEWVIKEFKPNQNILDTFIGSGSSLIACERMNKRMFAIEQEPFYCDVIVKRFQDWCEKNGRQCTIKRNGEPF